MKGEKGYLLIIFTSGVWFVISNSSYDYYEEVRKSVLREIKETANFFEVIKDGIVVVDTGSLIFDQEKLSDIQFDELCRDLFSTALNIQEAYTVRVLNGVTKYEWKSEQTWGGGGWEGTKVQEGFMTEVQSTGTQVWIGEGVFTGTIDGKSGTVIYKAHQFVPKGDFSQLEGKCTIIRGTGELKGICSYGYLIFDDMSTEWYIRIK